MPFGDVHVMFTLGVLLAAALAAGGLGQLARLPKVTSYLLMGVVLGPSVLGWVPREHIEKIEPLTKLAIALVLFNLGCHFPLARVRRIFRSVVRFSTGEMVLTFLLVSAGVWLLGQRWDGAILLGALAIATAPATTILVLKEMQSEGPVTEYAHALVAVNNFASIVLFELLFLAIHFAQGELRVSAAAELGYLARDLAGSAVLGIVAGLAMSFCYTLVSENHRLVLLVAIVTLALGAAIALSAIAVERDPVLGSQLQTIILGTVVVFEIAGPLLVRLAVIRSGGRSRPRTRRRTPARFLPRARTTASRSRRARNPTSSSAWSAAATSCVCCCAAASARPRAREPAVGRQQAAGGRGVYGGERRSTCVGGVFIVFTLWGW